MELYRSRGILWIALQPSYFGNYREVTWLPQNPIAKQWQSFSDSVTLVGWLGPSFSNTKLIFFLKNKTVFLWKNFVKLPGHSFSQYPSVHFPGELLGDVADPHGGLHGGEAGGLLIFGACSQMLLEHGQLQHCHGVLGRAQVCAVGNMVIWAQLPLTSWITLN